MTGYTGSGVHLLSEKIVLFKLFIRQALPDN